MSKIFVPHDEVTPGWWYIRTDYKPYYVIVYVLKLAFGPDEGEIVVYEMDREGYVDLDAYDRDAFISKVIPPMMYEDQNA